MAILGFELEEIVRLVALLESSGLSEIVFQEGDRSIRIRGQRSQRRDRDLSTPVHALHVAAPTAPRKTVSKRRAISASVANPTDEISLTSPMVGTFYRAEKPGAAPLIEVGQRVALGQSIGVIEAMKVFSEIPAEHAGIVVAVPAQDGRLVQVGEPLVVLRTEP